MQRDYAPEPDFLCARHQPGELTVFELKTPFVKCMTTSRRDGNRAKFKADGESYISQTIEYVDSIRESPEARRIVCAALDLESIASYQIRLVYGLREDNNPLVVSRLLEKRNANVDIIYYDSLLDRLVSAYALTRPDSTTRSGWCFVYYIAFPDVQAYTKAFIAEYGTTDGDRLSIYLEHNQLIFECSERQGISHRLSALIAKSQPHYIRFEFSNDNAGIGFDHRLVQNGVFR